MSDHTPRPSLRRRAGTATATLLMATLLLLLPVAAASAHVHVIPDSTASGSFSALTFRVPNESDKASTTTLQVLLPQDTPLLYVSVKPVLGWTAKITQADLPHSVVVDGITLTKAPRTVTWTADNAAAAIGPGQYQEFAISVGPLPAPGTLQLPATQTYSDGTVVKWDQPTPASGEEPEHPTPAFTITAATGSDDDATPATTHPAAAAGTTDSAGGAPAWVAISALVLAAAAALLGGGALLIARRKTPTVTP